MNDDALTAWVNEGAPVALSGEASAAKRRADFSQRFFEAMHPGDDLGVTEEEHEMGVARRVFVVHEELCAFGIDEYDAVWQTIASHTRAALKKYVSLAKELK